MDFGEIIKNHLLYGGLPKNVYNEIRPMIARENNDNFSRLSNIGIVFGSILTVLSMVGVLSMRGFPAYLFLLVSSLIFFAYRKFMLIEDWRMSYLTCTLQWILLLIFGILNCTVFSPDPKSNSTIFCVLVLVPAYLMVDLPYRLDPMVIILTALYCVMLRFYKDPDVIFMDTVNALAVCGMCCVFNWIYAKKNMENIANVLYIEKERDSDSLTGVLTRNAARIITNAKLAKERGGYFVIVDIDDFKGINDTYGHLYGDVVLQKVAKCIKENTNREDVVSRYGGDEFTIYIPHNNTGEITTRLEGLFHSLDKNFEGERIQITCSVGAARVQTTNYKEMFETADKALYKSKEEGKNCYTIV